MLAHCLGLRLGAAAKASVEIMLQSLCACTTRRIGGARATMAGGESKDESAEARSFGSSHEWVNQDKLGGCLNGTC